MPASSTRSKSFCSWQRAALFLLLPSLALLVPFLWWGRLETAEVEVKRLREKVENLTAEANRTAELENEVAQLRGSVERLKRNNKLRRTRPDLKSEKSKAKKLKSAGDDVAMAYMGCWNALEEKRSGNLAGHYSDAKVVLRSRRCRIGSDFSNNMSDSTNSVRQAVDSRNNGTRLAFSIVVHHELGILEELLGLIFSPRHSYCIYVDGKAKDIFKGAVADMVDCYKKRFPGANIFITPNGSPVYWGHISLLNADLQCLRLLLESDVQWDYYLNLAGSELPNLALEVLERHISDNLSGLSSVESQPMPKHLESRFLYRHTIQDGKRKPVQTNSTLPEPPEGIQIFKGIKNVVLNRTFAEFVAGDSPFVREFLEWSRDMSVPDESFFQTMIRVDMEQVTRTGNVSQDLVSPRGAFSRICKRYSKWRSPKRGGDQGVVPCFGSIDHGICRFSPLDLLYLPEDKNCLFLNKFDTGVSTEAVRCWTEMMSSEDDNRHKSLSWKTINPSSSK